MNLMRPSFSQKIIRVVGRVTKIRKGKFVWVSGQEQENNHIHKFGKTRENVKLIGGKSLRLAFIYHLGMFYIDKQRP